MTRQEILFNRLEGDGEKHYASVCCRGATRLVFSVDYEFEPESDGFFEEHPEFDGEDTYFSLCAEGRIGIEKFFPVSMKCLNDGIVQHIEKRRGLYSIDTTGLDEVRLVLDTQPPTSFPTTITVVGNLK